jgi:mono/diheme cytochrome c family protein
MPRWLVYTVAILVALSFVPLVLIARARTMTRTRPRVHLFQDMDNQMRYKAQQQHPLFLDGRAMRPPIPNTVAWRSGSPDTPRESGRADGEWVTTIPLEVSMELLERGQDRFNVFCAPCHGYAGYGDGPVSVRADRLQEGTWVPPTSLHDPVVRDRSDGYLYNVIVNGVRNMPAYGSQTEVEERWAIVAYVRALQLAEDAPLDAVPESDRRTLR